MKIEITKNQFDDAMDFYDRVSKVFFSLDKIYPSSDICVIDIDVKDYETLKQYGIL